MPSAKALIRCRLGLHLLVFEKCKSRVIESKANGLPEYFKIQCNSEILNLV